MKNKKILLLSLLIVCSSINYAEEINTTVFLETNYLKLKDKNKKLRMSFSEEASPESPWVNIWQNKNEIYETKYYDQNLPLLVNSNSIGLLATGTNVIIENSNEITVNNGGIGMTVINNAQMKNTKNGKIILNHSNEVGMLATKGTQGINSGSITLSGEGNYTQSGMAAENGGTSINNGEIIVNSNHSYGMLGNSDSTMKKPEQTSSINNGKIVLNKSLAGIGIESVDDLSIGINKKDIIIQDSTSARGMVSAKGAESINDGTISLVNSNQSFGMNIGDGNSVTGEHTIIKNTNNINIDSNSTGSIGMRVFKENGYEMKSGLGENTGTINVLGQDNIGMLASGINTEVINGKNIYLNGIHNIGVQSNLTGSSGINSGDIIISDTSKDSFGMVNFTGGSSINKGNIIINSDEGSNVGMQTVDGIAINNGNINLLNKNQLGMNSVGNTGVAKNEGNIKIDTSKCDISANTEAFKGISIGMTAQAGSTVINNNIIQLEGTGTGKAMSNELNKDKNVNLVNIGEILIKSNSSFGMTVTQDSSITNEKSIQIMGNENKGIVAGQNSIVKTTKGSNITLKGNNNTGIYLTNAKLINEGDIIISGDNNVGIRATNNSTVTNSGTINIENGNNNIGINIEKESTLNNTGTILIKGQDVTSTPGAGRPDKNIGIRNGGTFINNGKLIASDEFNSDALGSGSFIMGKDSSLEADKIKGNIQLSSRITTGSLDNEYSTYKMFNTKEMEANLTSDSYLFNAKLNSNNCNYYDAILTRKDFNEIVKDSNLANYLESNYTDTGNSSKIAFYDKFKLASNQVQLDNIVTDTFGIKTFPALEKQTFEMLKLNEDILQSNISKDSLTQNFGYIVGGAYNKIDTDSSQTTAGYMASLKNIWLGGEKKINDNLKYGLVFSIGDYNVNFDNDSDRKDRIYQGTLFLNYNKNDVNARTFLTIGKAKSDLDRESKSFSEKLTSSFNTEYTVWTNEISKKITLPYDSYLTPKLGFKIYNLNQEKIKENGEFGVALDKVNTLIMEPSIGFTLGKNINLKDNYILTPELSMNYIHRSGDLKNNLKGRIESVSNDEFKLSGYEFKKDTGDIKIKLGISKEDWTVFGSYRMTFENKVNSIGTIGINYKF